MADDDRTLIATDGKTGKTIWKSNVIQTAGKPNAGQPVITNLSIKDDVLAALYGKNSFARFDVKTGRLLEQKN